MGTLIDGYNLLHVMGILGRGIGPGTLERARHALLNTLAVALDADEISQTTVVFDAKDPPPGLPNVVTHRGIAVHYAANHEDADALIEELIRADSAPKSLTVVSSDHRLQRVARRRKAQPVDSEAWHDSLLRRAKAVCANQPNQQSPKPVSPLSEKEVADWLREFGDSESSQATSSDGDTSEPVAGEEERGVEDERADLKPGEAAAGGIANPFPPGYGEDLLDDGRKK